MEKVFTEKEAAGALHVSLKTLYNLREAGKLSHVRVGSRVLYRERDLEEFLESQVRPATALRLNPQRQSKQTDAKPATHRAEKGGVNDR